MDGLQLSVLGHGGIKHGDGGFQEFVLLVDVANVEVDLGPLVQVLHVVQDDVGFHRQDALDQLFQYFEGVVASPQQRRDVRNVSDSVVGDVEVLGPLLDGHTVH